MFARAGHGDGRPPVVVRCAAGATSRLDPMAMDVSTKDCTALSDAELVEMADLCADRPPGFDIGYLSKEREAWVLITRAREGNKLRGYSFCTLERIGGGACAPLGPRPPAPPR